MPGLLGSTSSFATSLGEACVSVPPFLQSRGADFSLCACSPLQIARSFQTVPLSCVLNSQKKNHPLSVELLLRQTSLVVRRKVPFTIQPCATANQRGVYVVCF